ncbi:YcnI family copper-binding membrane protein [Actinomadura scrupuli]|uniref:YcnI family copper-binding membrane protein n=1 Tax=Actinomadura scrupuli TaxID=559629 RepID=UPI003D976EA2
MHSSRHALARVAGIGGTAALALLMIAGPATAHVTANPRSAEQGSYSKISFRVPNEEGTARNTSVEVDLPLDHPIASVSVRPIPGWTIKIDKSRLATPLKSDDGEITQAVSKITWSGGSIAPGEFQEFDVSMGPLPTDTDRLVFKARQTYTGGKVVSWDQDPGNGGQEPEHPAPVLRLTPKGSGAGTGTTAQVPVADRTEAAEAADDGTARFLGGLGLAVGVIGIAVGGFALARVRRRA